MSKRRNKTLAFVVPGLVVIGLGVALLYLQRRGGPVLPPLKPAPVYVEKSTTAGRKASHDSMLESLAAIKERAPKDHQYFGREAHLELRKELEDLSADDLLARVFDPPSEVRRPPPPTPAPDPQGARPESCQDSAVSRCRWRGATGSGPARVSPGKSPAW